LKRRAPADRDLSSSLTRLSRHGPRALSALLLLLACASCAGARSSPSPHGPLGALVLPAEGRSLVMLDGHDGRVVSWPALVQRARRADVVLWGESHGHPQGLAAAAFVFEELLEDEQLSPAVALEFLTRDQQLGLDDFLSGVTDEAGMVRALGLSKSSFPNGHRAMVRGAKRAGAQVWAANAPRRYVSLARKRGYPFLSSLGPRQREQFVLPRALTTGEYRERFEQIMAESGSLPPAAAVEATFRSQNLWDATMADSVRQALRAGGKPAMLVVGHFHVGFDGGLVQRVRAAAPGRAILTVAVLSQSADTLQDEDRGRADVVIYAGERSD